MVNSKILEKWAKHLFSHNRSITGKGSLKTLQFIKNNINKNFIIKKVKSGTRIYSWKIPKEFLTTYGVLKDEDGKEICNLKNNKLHVINGSKSVNKWLDYNNLKKNIFVSKRVPAAIPFVTSYYKKNWGFCISKKTFSKLNKSLTSDIFLRSLFFSNKSILFKTKITSFFILNISLITSKLCFSIDFVTSCINITLSE